MASLSHIYGIIVSPYNGLYGIISESKSLCVSTPHISICILRPICTLAGFGRYADYQHLWYVRLALAFGQKCIYTSSHYTCSVKPSSVFHVHFIARNNSLFEYHWYGLYGVDNEFVSSSPDGVPTRIQFRQGWPTYPSHTRSPILLRRKPSSAETCSELSPSLWAHLKSCILLFWNIIW